MRTYLTNPPPINPVVRAAHAASTSSRCRTPIPTNSTTRLPRSKRGFAICRSWKTVSSDLQLKNPQVRVAIDRDKLGPLWPYCQSGGDGSWQRLRQPAGDADLRTEQSVPGDSAGRPVPERPAALRERMCVRSSSGRLVPLDTVATVNTDTGPLAVSHAGQAAVSDGVVQPETGRGALATLSTQQLQTTAASVLPSTVSTHFQGTAQAFLQDSLGLGIILVMAIVVIYIVLGIPVRELHASTDDSGVCRRPVRRAADAVHLRPTSVSTRLSASSCLWVS